MTLGERIPDATRTILRSNANTMFWLALFTFLSTLVVFVLLQRLGLPTEIVIGAIFILSIVAIAGLAWTSRTMTSSVFFYANRALGPFTSGLGSTSDLLSGAMLILFFSTNLAGRMVIATGLVLGVLLQAALFSSAFHRSGVSSLPGYFTWRYQRKIIGYPALLAVFALLAMLAMAEFQVANSILQIQTGLPLEQTAWIVVILAVLPSVFGGWTGLLLVNATLVIWMLACTLVPAVATGFFAPALSQALQMDLLGNPLEVLNLAPSMTLLGAGDFASIATIVLSVFMIAAGVSTLPHTLSRLSTNSRPVEAIESVGWLALMVFLMLSALPLSLGLIIASPTSTELAVVLQGQPVLQMLPYFVVLFAALNALSVTLFTAASSVVRATSRMRNLDPGDQSVFSTRLGVLLLAGVLLKWPESLTVSPEYLLVSALMLAAGGLFVPLVASTWLRYLSVWTVSAAILGGSLTTAILLSPLAFSVGFPASWAGGCGALVAFVLIAGDRVTAMMRRRAPKMNSSVLQLRRH